MVRWFRRRLNSDERGLSLIEILVAIMVFGIVAMGVAYTLANILTLTKDARSRVVAANLAASVIDEARSFENVFSVLGNGALGATGSTPYKTTVVDGTTYSVYLDARWVTDADTTSQCGAAAATGSSALQYKRINVEVIWEGMRSGTTPVRSDTLIAPNSRINEPTLGSIVISVSDELGLPRSGVTSSTTVASVTGNTAVAVAAQGLATDSDGCSYVLKVVPGTYNVTVSKTGYVDLMQVSGTSTVKTVTVAAGGTALAGFTFDNGALITPRYPTGAVTPTNLQMTFSTTFGTKTLVAASPTRVFPFSSGYQVLPGTLSDTCKSPDPAQWPTRVDGAIGVRIDPITVAPGGSATIDVAMGVVSFSKSGLNGKYIHAVLQTTGANGDPGCVTPLNAAGGGFPKYVSPKATSDAMKLALPYGTYKFYFTSSATDEGTNTISGTVLINGVATGAAASTLTLDPRQLP